MPLTIFWNVSVTVFATDNTVPNPGTSATNSAFRLATASSKRLVALFAESSTFEALVSLSISVATAGETELSSLVNGFTASDTLLQAFANASTFSSFRLLVILGIELSVLATEEKALFDTPEKDFEASAIFSIALAVCSSLLSETVPSEFTAVVMFFNPVPTEDRLGSDKELNDCKLLPSLVIAEVSVV